jgi:DNA-binding SARP family transcriptional activator
LLRDIEGISGIVVDRDEVRVAPDGVLIDVWTSLERVQNGEIDPILLERRNICDSLLAQLEDLDPAFRSWLLVQRRSLHERLVYFLESRLAELVRDTDEVERGNPEEKTVALALLNLDPTHEGACRQLMRASVREGDVAGALRRYNALWELLGDEYDVEPSEETQRLVASIKMGDIATPSREAWPRAPSRPSPHLAESGVAYHSGHSHQRRLRIIVGPFEAAGVDEEQRYLVSGFRHQLISSLVWVASHGWWKFEGGVIS